MKYIFSLILSLVIVGIISLPSIALAVNVPKLPNPFDTTDIPTLTGRIIQSILGLVGVLALVMFIYGGITWMISGGKEEMIKKGRDTLVWATIGLAFIFFAYSLVHFLLERLMGAAK